jgi:hypothetical protein
VPEAPIATPEDRARCDAAIAAWARSAGVTVTSSGAARSEDVGEGRAVKAPAVLAVERDPSNSRWYVRLKGVEKDIVTIWLTIRQRTLRYETHFMPAPETNIGETYEYLLRRNAALVGMRFCLGVEDAVFLVGELPVADVTEAEVDRIIGTSLENVEATFASAMTLGYSTSYKRRRGRR